MATIDRGHGSKTTKIGTDGVHVEARNKLLTLSLTLRFCELAML